MSALAGAFMAQESLNSNHARRLSVTCQHIDKLLADMENAVSVSASERAFPEYIPDVTPAQRQTIEDYIARIRSQLARILDGQGIERPAPRIPASRSLYTILTFIGIAAEELQPKYMRGYGEIPPAAAVDLNGIAAELLSLTHQLDQYIKGGAGENLEKRLLELEKAGNDVALLKKLEAIISEQGLVEFRSTVSMILDRLADNSFEIAVFGRVSSGKSSLLNAVLGTDVLPVGVTPITAVPTRIVYGEIPALHVWFANRPPDQFDTSRLPEFVTEQGNPGNEKHVTRVVLHMSSPRLRDGVTFVDTPGLGSLATRGAAETLAYLPRCDLGVVLMDAGSALTGNDLNTVQTLYEAGIPANILVSKADLLSAEDRGRVIEYVRSHLRSELNLEAQVHAVSAMAKARDLVTEWFEKDIAPLYNQSRELKLRSTSRKVGTLLQSIEVSLEGRLRQSKAQPTITPETLRELEARLRQAGGRAQEARATVRQIASEIRDMSSSALADAAAGLMNLGDRGSKENDAEQVVLDVVNQTVRGRSKRLYDLVSALGEELHHTLLWTANTLCLSDAPTAEEFSSHLREMPLFDLGPIFLRMTRPTMVSFLGRSFAERWTARGLTRSIGRDMERALSAYSQLAGDWSDRMVGQIQSRFDAHANRYRALVERLAVPHELSSEQKQAILRNLNFLRREHAKELAPAVS
ncbi:MAG TPA: dynamin family protein [Terriglobales bacterium]|nr:dynamin family protein [Terriglobales bacterium]